MNRRDFIKKSGLVMVASTLGNFLSAEENIIAVKRTNKLPRWRGFNLTEKFNAAQNSSFKESDFQWISEWGFDFVRLPMSYHCWSSPHDLKKFDEKTIKEIDQAIEFGKKYKIHVNLNFHRAPGYCVNPPREEKDLWTDSEILDACAKHWQFFAKRYKGISSKELSFDLLNEPPDIPESTYFRVIRYLVQAIRAEDPERLIIADGLKWGTMPAKSLASLGIAQSTRGYQPMQISHYKASWVQGSDRWSEPTWPLVDPSGNKWDKNTLKKRCIDPWTELQSLGVGVHVGECGAFNRTPHNVVLAWLEDLLSLWKENGWGFALWNFRGTFGILDSRRADVEYDDFHGHKLDSKLLKLLQKY